MIKLLKDCIVMLLKNYKFTKHHAIAHLQWMEFTVYKLSLMKHIFLKNEYYLIISAVNFQNFHVKVGKLFQIY